MEKKQIIDFGNLEHFIKQIEDIFAENEVNPIEQNLILSQTLNRLQTKEKNHQAQDMIHNISLGGLFKRLTKQRDEDDKG